MLTGKAGRSIQVVVGLLVSAICLVLAFRAVPLDEVGHALERANYWWLVPSVICQLLAAFTRARRWQVLLGGRAAFWELFWAQGIGFLFTNILPLRAGEAARIVVANRRTGIPFVQLGLSVVVERALDMLTVLLLLGVVMLLMPVPTYVTSAAVALGAVVVLAGLVMLVLSFRRGAYDAIAATLCRWLPRRLVDPLAARWHELMLGLEAVRQPLPALRAIGWSLVTWAAYVVALWAIVEAFVPGASFVEPAFATVALAFGVTVPSSPGFLGVFQLVGQQALVVPFPDRYSPSAALSIALLANLVDLGPPSVLGLLGLLRLGISPGALRQPLQAEPDPNAA